MASDHGELSLTDDEVRTLEIAGVILQPAIAGKLKVSLSSWNPLAGIYAAIPTGASLSGPPSVTISIRDPQPARSPDAHSLWPRYVESVETLEQMGFERATAQALFDYYILRPQDQNPKNLLDYALDHVNRPGGLQADSSDDRNLSNDDALRRCGLRQEFRDAVLDPEFSDCFGTGSLWFWTRDTIEGRYRCIQGKHEELKARAAQEQATQATSVSGNF